METAASFEARYAPSSYPTHWRPRQLSRHYARRGVRALQRRM